MFRSAIRHVCLNGLGALVLCTAPAHLVAEPQLVLVIDQARVPAAELAEAEEYVALIFRKALVELRLLDCGLRTETQACNDLFGERPLFLRILPTRPVTVSKAALGCADTTPQGGRLATIFYAGINHFIAEAKPPASRAQILGYAMAHEIGHLLAGPKHALSGLMRGKWDGADLRRMARVELLISAPEATVMRERVRQRNGPGVALELVS